MTNSKSKVKNTKYGTIVLTGNKELDEQIERIAAADFKRVEFCRGGMTPDKLYQLENRLKNATYDLRELRKQNELVDRIATEIFDISLIIETFGKQIDPHCN